jgi:nucleoside-diphosphate-sugar epimerase
MNSVLIIGCGDIAMRVIPLLRQKYRVFALVRNPSNFARLRSLSVVPVAGDLDDRTSLLRIAGLSNVVLHFAPPQNQGELDTGTRNLLSVLGQRSGPKRLIYLSTSGVYGDCRGAWINESHLLNPQTARARRRVDAEVQIRGWAIRNGVQASILRVPGIYAADRLPLERLRTGSPAIVSNEDSYTNHIHADDLARIVIMALRNGKPNRIYHACDSSEMKMGDYFDIVADAYDLPRPARKSRAEVEQSVSPTLWSFMNESRRLSNERMKQELKVSLRYTKVTDALTSKIR